MTLNILTPLVLAPLAVGLLLASAAQNDRISPSIAAVAFSAVFAFIYLLHEGLPPIPPVSSKQKLAVALSVTPFILLLCSRFESKRKALAFALFAGACFLWLIQRPLLAGRWNPQWVLPLLTIALFTTVLNAPSIQNVSRFAWPVTILFISVTSCALATLGGFLGLGQVLISISAFVGGSVLALYLSLLRNPGLVQSHQPMLPALILGLGLMLVQLSTFATNLSVLGYLLMLTLVTLPIADRKISHLPVLIQPFVYGGAGLLLAIPAVLMAARNF